MAVLIFPLPHCWRTLGFCETEKEKKKKRQTKPNKTKSSPEFSLDKKLSGRLYHPNNKCVPRAYFGEGSFYLFARSSSILVSKIKKRIVPGCEELWVQESGVAYRNRDALSLYRARRHLADHC